MSDLQSEKILRSLGVKEWAVLCTWLAQQWHRVPKLLDSFSP